MQTVFSAMIFSLVLHLALFGALAFSARAPKHGPTVNLTLLDGEASKDRSKPSVNKKMATESKMLAPEAVHKDVGDVNLTEVMAGFEGATPSPTGLYLAALREKIRRHQVYPEASRLLREAGTVQLRLTLARSGALVKIEILETSTYPRLDNQALKAAAEAAPFGVFPAEVGYDFWRVTLPVRFHLFAG